MRFNVLIRLTFIRLTYMPKAVWLSLMMIGWVSGATAQTLPALDNENGFFGIALGQPLPTDGSFEEQGTFQQKKRLVRPDQELSMGEIRFVYVWYLVYENQLHSIRIRTAGEASSEQFLELLQLLYGNGEQDGFAPRYAWQGKRVKLFYDRNIISGNAEIVFTSLPVDAEFRKTYIQIGDGY